MFSVFAFWVYCFEYYVSSYWLVWVYFAWHSLASWIFAEASLQRWENLLMIISSASCSHSFPFSSPSGISMIQTLFILLLSIKNLHSLSFGYLFFNFIFCDDQYFCLKVLSIWISVLRLAVVYLKFSVLFEWILWYSGWHHLLFGWNFLSMIAYFHGHCKKCWLKFFIDEGWGFVWAQRFGRIIIYRSMQIPLFYIVLISWDSDSQLSEIWPVSFYFSAVLFSRIC